VADSHAPGTAAPGTADALLLIRGELDALIARTAEQDLEAFTALVAGADRVFVHGAGRSGIALRMTAMRLMHLGLVVHVVGDATTPAIGAGDVLLTASGSGTTAGIVRAAENATAAGARVAVITTAADSPLARLASAVVVLPAAGKQDRSGTASAQYAGSLFEQGVALLGDAIFHALWQRSGLSADDIWPRHSNLE
jgi:6-phospho-3-hexuloisomerase